MMQKAQVDECKIAEVVEEEEVVVEEEEVEVVEEEEGLEVVEGLAELVGLVEQAELQGMQCVLSSLACNQLAVMDELRCD